MFFTTSNYTYHKTPISFDLQRTVSQTWLQSTQIYKQKGKKLKKHLSLRSEGATTVMEVQED